MVIFKHCMKALILYKNNIQQERKAKRKECIYTALILYKNNIQQKRKKNVLMQFYALILYKNNIQREIAIKYLERI